MEFFPDRAHVRLRSRTLGMYLHADSNGVDVTLSTHRASPGTAWIVHRLERAGTDYVLLHGAAYGYYIGFSTSPPYHLAQCVFNEPDSLVVWLPTRAEDGSDHAVLSHSIINLPVHVPGADGHHWSVQMIPPRAHPPALPASPRVVAETMDKSRIVKFCLGDENGNPDPDTMREQFFAGRSVSNLLSALAKRLNEKNPLKFIPCARAGSDGRLIPLFVDLPTNNQAVEIVLFTAGSPASQALVYPDVEAP